MSLQNVFFDNPIVGLVFALVLIMSAEFGELAFQAHSWHRSNIRQARGHNRKMSHHAA